jgi:hypothetical protein
MFAPRARYAPIHPTVITGFSLGDIVGFIKDGAEYLYKHDPIVQAFAKVVSGENVWQALKDSGQIALEDVRTFGPYLAYIPGIGTAAAMAIAAGVALASGKRLDDIALAAARGALPPGPAQAAFDVANSILHGKSIDDSILGAFKDVYPPVSQAAVAAIQTAYDLSKGKSLSEAALAGIREALPQEMRGPFDVGVAIAKGKRVQDALIDGVKGMLPAEYQAAFEAAKALASGKGLVEAAIAAAKAELPPAAQSVVDLAHDLVKGEKLQDALLDAAKDAVPAEYKRYFEMAMGLEQSVMQLVSQVKSQIPSGSSAKDAYAYAKKTALALFTNDLVKTLRDQVPDGPAKMAFDAGVEILKGKSIEAVAIEAAKGLVPDNLKKTYQEAASAANSLVHGGNIADVAMDTFLANLPDGAQAYAKLAIGIIKGGKVADAAVAAARAQFSADDLAAFDKAMGIAKGNLRATLTDEAKSFVSSHATSYANIIKADAQDSVYQDVTDNAKQWIDASGQVAAVAQGVPTNAKAAFQRGVDLAKGQLAHYLAVESLKQLIPPEYQAAFDQAQAFVMKYAPSDIHLSAIREKVGAAAQHVIDGATNLYKASPPENAFDDQAFKTAFATMQGKAIAAGLAKARTPSKTVSATSGAIVKASSLNLLAGNEADTNPTLIALSEYRAAKDIVEKTIDTVAIRRAALGAVNRPAKPVHADVKALLDARVKSYQKSDFPVVPVIAVGAAAFAVYYFRKGH